MVIERSGTGSCQTKAAGLERALTAPERITPVRPDEQKRTAKMVVRACMGHSAAADMAGSTQWTDCRGGEAMSWVFNLVAVLANLLERLVPNKARRGTRGLLGSVCTAQRDPAGVGYRTERA